MEDKGVPVDHKKALELANKGCHGGEGHLEACALSSMIILTRQSEILAQTTGYLAGTGASITSYQFDNLNREFDALQVQVDQNNKRLCSLDASRC